MVADRESAELAKLLLDETIRKYNILPGQLTIHADRGADSGRSRSRFRTDGDHRSEVMSITIPAGWRSVFDRRIGMVIDMSSG